MIRSITIGVPLLLVSRPALADQLRGFAVDMNAELSRAGLQSRTVRLTLPSPRPGPTPDHHGVLKSMTAGARELADLVGARWYCLPLDLVAAPGLQYVLGEAQDLPVRDDRLFVNLVAASSESISLPAAQQAARFVLGLARRSASGIDNFRVGISANCAPSTPFFPFSRHEGEEAAFSLALESTQTALFLARTSRDEGASLSEFRDALVRELGVLMREADAFGMALTECSGLDASFAPFPDGRTSVAELIECLGPSPAGAHGSVFATSLVTDALKAAAREAGVRTVGFNGVMFSVLEDDGLARASDLRSIDLGRLALLSTVCGCGIDMVPVPATMFPEDIAGLVLDVAALAVRLNKPLGVRLLPVPNKTVNELTELNLDFLHDSRVMDPGVSSSRPWPGGEWRYRMNDR